MSKLAVGFSMKIGFNGRLEKYRVLTVKEHLIGEEILDVGCADGWMARELSRNFGRITAIDGSLALIAKANEHGLRNVDFICTLFEEFQPKRKFDSVVLSDILEHVDDPIWLLQLSRSWVSRDGVVFILCPNANSIHRQIGVHAGMLNDTHELNEFDLQVGHRRVYDIDLLTKDICRAKLRVVKTGGMFLKPLSNEQMDQLEDGVVDAFYEIGKRLPAHLLSEIYAVCKR